jgi:UDP-N-acetyl-D-glucosamine dehydrogenase
VNVTIIGQGYVGLPIAVCAAENGFKVTGYDSDTLKISRLKSGVTDSMDIGKDKLLNLQSQGNLQFESELDEKTISEIFIIAVPTPLDRSGKPDLSMLENACLTISKFVKQNALVINESTSYIGTLRNFIKVKIEEYSGITNIDYAVAPERIDPNNKKWSIQNTPRIVSGLTDIATERAFDFYSKFCSQVHKVSKPEVIEAAKLFENSFRLVNISLVNELSELANKFNFSIHEVVASASTKPFGFMPFYPSIGIGGHCIPVDPSYLRYSAETVGVEINLINQANKINSNMPNYIATRIKSIFGGDLKDKTIQLAGITYKPNVSDLREAPALELIEILEKFGAIVTWYDPLVGVYGKEKSTPLSKDIDMGLIVTPHEGFDFSIWHSEKIKVLDLSANSNDYGWPKFL